MYLFRIIQSKKPYFIAVILFSIFLLAGGFSALDAYMNGASSYEQYVTASLAPLFAGCLLMGSFGLMYIYKNHGNSRCLIGLFITLFCYGFIEYLFGVV